MKKLLSFCTALFAVIFSTNAQNCNYSVEMHDAWGDGWNGGEMLVTIGGQADTIQYPFGGSAQGGNQQSDSSVALNVNVGDALEAEWLGGSTWNDEIWFEILNDVGDTLYAHPYGTGPSAGVVYSGTVLSCSGNVGISEEANNLLTVYPNPNNGDFFISNDGDADNVEIHVYNIQGKEVYNSIFNLSTGASEMISLSNLNTGLYVLHMNTNKGRMIHSIVIQ